VGVYLSDDELISAELDELQGSCEVPGLAAGAIESEENLCTVKFNLPEDLTPGTLVYIGAIADDERVVEEGDEVNNKESVEVEIVDGDCERVFRDTLKECHQAGASISECVGQALAAQKECERGL
jgi:hypothetical protein